MGSMDERKIWKHWAYLKNELQVEDLLDSMVESGVFTAIQAKDIANVQPNTRQMKAEKFLNSLINSGDKGFESFCNILRRDNENRYKALMEKLDIGPPRSVSQASSVADSSRPDSARMTHHRPPSGMSASSVSTDISARSSIPSLDGETGERNMKRGVRSAKNAWRSESSASESPMHSNGQPHVQQPIGGNGSKAPGVREDLLVQPSTLSQPVMNNTSTVSNISNNMNKDNESNLPHGDDVEMKLATDKEPMEDNVQQNEKLSVDVKTVEEELVRIAPTIAELFQKFAKTTSKQPISEEEIRDIKQENERLRKTNRALIEKLNIFQHRIIQLQSENKKLKDDGEGVIEAKEELDRKEFELKNLEKRLEEQKRLLEEKEMELNDQLLKIKDIEMDIAGQREQITNLQILHEEDQLENERQQQEIYTLKEDKKKQQQQILKLEFKQRMGEERLQSLDARLKQLEQPPKQRSFRRSETKIKPRRPLGMFYS